MIESVSKNSKKFASNEDEKITVGSDISAESRKSYSIQFSSSKQASRKSSNQGNSDDWP